VLLQHSRDDPAGLDVLSGWSSRLWGR